MQQNMGFKFNTSLKIKKLYNFPSTTASDSRYRFTGKELSEESGEYDFGARFLDPAPGQQTDLCLGMLAIMFVTGNGLLMLMKLVMSP